MRPSERALRLFATVLPFFLWAQPALSQEGVTTFTPADFASAVPANALEMVARVPGFTIIAADEDVRGYAGAQGNVLIDSAAPASKRESIHDILRRIPSRAVERIELIRGSGGASEHVLIVNVVRRATGRNEGAIELGVERATQGAWAPRAALEYGRRDGAATTQLAFTAFRETDEDSGRGYVIGRDVSGALTADDITDANRTIDTVALTLSHRRPLFRGQLTLTGALRAEDERKDETILSRDGAESEYIRETEDLREVEAGVRQSRPLGAHTALELLASQQNAWRRAAETVREGEDHAAFSEDTESGETILRGELTHDTQRHVVLSASLEAAFNFLESAAALTENGVGVLLPGSDVRIEETRAEAAFGARWRVRQGLTLQAGLRVETSSISQTGDTALDRDFTFIKPRATAAWDIGGRNQLRLIVTREADQLDFSDFVAAASFATGTVSAGNAELAPAQTWRTSIAWERQFWADGALTLTLIHDAIDDATDRVPIEAGGDVFDAPGNIGQAWRDTMQVEFATSFSAVGLPNVRVTAEALWRRSEVTDPTTQERRPISDEPVREGEIELTHVLASRGLQWGVRYELAQKETRWRFDDVAQEHEAASWTIFAEQRFADHWRLRLEASDLFGREISDTRTRYDGPRDDFPVSEIERRSHRAPGRMLLILRRNMGD